MSPSVCAATKLYKKGFFCFIYVCYYTYMCVYVIIHICVCVYIYIYTHTHTLKVKVAQSCPVLCDPMDYTVHGILQARILE